ncbi:MAG: ribosome maturation factor RimP [Elainellaceae cyanobacterium]
MTHPLIPQVLEIATPVAENLGLELVGATFHTNQNPPVLRVDIRNMQQDTSLDDCEAMSRALEAALDLSELIPDQYVLEISSPGISRVLETEREFVAFKGFPVRVKMAEPFKGQTTWSGQLIRRDQEAVHLSRKGRAIAIPRALIGQVQLDDRRED